MAQLFAIQTYHGTSLFLDRTTGRVLHRDSTGHDGAQLELLLLRGSTSTRWGFVVAVDPREGEVLLGTGAGFEAVLLISPPDDTGAVTLRSALPNMFISAIPNGDIEANRTVADSWERFTLNAVSPIGGRAAEDAAGFAALVQILPTELPVWPEVLLQLVTGTPSDEAAALIGSIWKLLTVAEFDRFARQLLLDGRLSKQLAALFPADFWAVTALPALLAWMAERSAPTIAAGQPSTGPPRAWAGAWRAMSGWMRRSKLPERLDRQAEPKQKPPENIGPELDHLARGGYDGVLASVAHACHAALRLTVQPCRDIAIVATARSEGVYLLEWIAYHRLLGVDKFFLYSNDNDDGSDALLAALHTARIVTWTRSELASGSSAQSKAYGHALNVNLALLDYRWGLFVDIDEFLVLNPARYSGIREFTRRQEMRETDAVGINWVMVGSSGHLRWAAEPLTRRNTHLLGATNPHIKVMMSPRHFIHAHPHFPYVDPRRGTIFRLASGELHEHRNQPRNAYHAQAFADEPSETDACIYHYFFKSVDEFVWKNARNRGDYPMSHGISFQSIDQGAASAFLSQHISTNVRQDDRILRCAPGLDAEIERLRGLPGVRDAETAVTACFQVRLAEVKTAFRKSQRLFELGTTGEEFRTLLRDAGG
jgi:hypothetical protein